MEIQEIGCHSFFRGNKFVTIHFFKAMDIGRIGRYLASWRFGFHLSLSFAAVHIILAVMDFHAAYLAGITFHTGIALMCQFLDFYE